MSLPLLATRLFIPAVRKELLPRPILTGRLSAGLDRKLTLVSAPAGFGKTMLLAAWMAESSAAERQAGEARRFCWLSLDRADNDPARFWCHLISALQTNQPGIGAAALEALQLPQPLPVQALLPGLINEIALLSTGVVLVLDDLHQVSSQAIHEDLLFLLENLPPSVHLVVSTRADPPWPLARLRARGQVNELRTHDLRFTPQEASEFLRGISGLTLSEVGLASLAERTEGWIAGLQLAGLSLQGRDDPEAFVRAFSGSNRFVLDFLAEEVLARLDPPVEEFLLKTSILERMNADLCDAVVGHSGVRDAGSASRLEYLEKANLFVVPLDDERGWYRYHHLFADLLRARLARTAPQEVSTLHRRASAWLAGAGLVDEAIDQALAAEDMQRAAGLVEQVARHMFLEVKRVTLSRWIEALPEDVVRARPWLCVYHAWTHHSLGSRGQVEEWLVSAETALAGAPQNLEGTDSPPAVGGFAPEERRLLVAHIAAIRALNMDTSGDLAGVMELAPRALALTREGEYIRTTIALALAGGYWGQGDVVATQGAFELTRQNALKGGYRYWSVSSACYVGMQQAKRGRLHEAFETYRQARELAATPGGFDVPVAGFPKVRMADILREWNDLSTASELVSAGVEQCAQYGQVDILADAYVALARIQLARRQTDLAWKTLARADDLARRGSIDRFVLGWLEDCRVRALLAAGDLEGRLAGQRAAAWLLTVSSATTSTCITSIWRGCWWRGGRPTLRDRGWRMR